jgi:hypothetical protein
MLRYFVRSDIVRADLIYIRVPFLTCLLYTVLPFSSAWILFMTCIIHLAAYTKQKYVLSVVQDIAFLLSHHFRTLHDQTCPLYIYIVCAILYSWANCYVSTWFETRTALLSLHMSKKRVLTSFYCKSVTWIWSSTYPCISNSPVILTYQLLSDHAKSKNRRMPELVHFNIRSYNCKIWILKQRDVRRLDSRDEFRSWSSGSWHRVVTW